MLLRYIVPEKGVRQHGKLLRRYFNKIYAVFTNINLLIYRTLLAAIFLVFLLISILLLQYLIPYVEKERYQIPRTCRLHPDNDLYRDQEQHKIRIDIYEWQCGYCKKRFYEESFLDKHFDNRHYNLLNVVGALCFYYLVGVLTSDN